MIEEYTLPVVQAYMAYIQVLVVFSNLSSAVTICVGLAAIQSDHLEYSLVVSNTLAVLF
jgi:hypothetical protein